MNGVWGWDPLLQACWITSTDYSTRARWTVGTVFAPSFVASALSLLAVATVLWRLVAMDLAMRRVVSQRCRSVTPETMQNKLFRRVALRILWYPCLLGMTYSGLLHTAAYTNGSWWRFSRCEHHLNIVVYRHQQKRGNNQQGGLLPFHCVHVLYERSSILLRDRRVWH